jgi:hypothetical protein
MKTKKILFAVLTVALVTTFIIGCISPLDSTNSGEVKEQQSAPAGKTLVSLNLGGSKSNSRTVVPDTSTYDDVTKFDNFKLTIYDTDEEEYVDLSATKYNGIFDLVDIYDSSGPTWDFEVSLDSGKEYKFTIFAYKDSDLVNPLACGSDTKTIASSGNDSVTIILKEIFLTNPDSYHGSVSWTLSGYDSYNITLTPLAGGSNVIASGGTNSSGTQGNILPGKYMMVLTLGEDRHQTAYVREMVYIYSGFTTELNSSTLTLPTLRRNIWVVTFDAGSDSTNDIDGEEMDINHGSVISSALATYFSSTGGKPAYSGTDQHFDKWYYTDEYGVQTTEIGNTDKMIKDITLLATWAPDSKTVIDMSGGGGLDLQWSATPGSADADFTGSLFTYNNTKRTLDLTLRADVTGATSYKWFMDFDGDDQTPLSQDDNFDGKYSLNATDDYVVAVDWFQTGKYTITLITNNGSYTFEYDYDPDAP